MRSAEPRSIHTALFPIPQLLTADFPSPGSNHHVLGRALRMHRGLAGAAAHAHRQRPHDGRVPDHRRHLGRHVRVCDRVGSDVGRLQLEAELPVVSRAAARNGAQTQRQNVAVAVADNGRRTVFDRQGFLLRDRQL